MMDRNGFEQFLFDTRGEPDAQRWRGPLIDVADTMFACKKWFEGYGVSYTAADLVNMARLVLNREAGSRS